MKGRLVTWLVIYSQILHSYHPAERELTPKEHVAKAEAIADRIERINATLDDIADKDPIAGRPAEEYVDQAQHALTAASDDLNPD